MKAALIIEDSSTIRKVCRRILEKLLFGVLEVDDLQEALNHCERMMPDVILLDWDMHRDSDKLVALIRDQPEGGKPKIVFYTSRTEPAVFETGLKAGADGYFGKPFDLEIVKAKLKEVGALP